MARSTNVSKCFLNVSARQRSTRRSFSQILLCFLFSLCVFGAVSLCLWSASVSVIGGSAFCSLSCSLFVFLLRENICGFCACLKASSLSAPVSTNVTSLARSAFVDASGGGRVAAMRSYFVEQLWLQVCRRRFGTPLARTLAENILSMNQC